MNNEKADDLISKMSSLEEAINELKGVVEDLIAVKQNKPTRADRQQQAERFLQQQKIATKTGSSKKKSR